MIPAFGTTLARTGFGGADFSVTSIANMFGKMFLVPVMIAIFKLNFLDLRLFVLYVIGLFFVNTISVDTYL